MKMQISKIEARSFTDGPGERTVLFSQGCPVRCPGCQSAHLWNTAGGRMEEVIDIARTLALLSAKHGNVTLSGGEELSQPAALTELVYRLRQYGVKHIILYTGFTWESLHNPAHPVNPWLKEILQRVDVLVDGPFIASQDDDLIAWRGSRNQRAIDVAASLEAGEVVTLDWDAPQIVITEDGEVLFPAGLEAMFAEVGEMEPARMCGQSR